MGNDVAIAVIKEMKTKGVQIEAPPCDLIDAATLKHVLDICARYLPPIKGYVQGSILLRDVMLGNKSYNN